MTLVARRLKYSSTYEFTCTVLYLDSAQVRWILRRISSLDGETKMREGLLALSFGLLRDITCSMTERRMR